MEPGRFPASAAEVAADPVEDSMLRHAPRKRDPPFDLGDPGECRTQEVRPIRRNNTSSPVFPLPPAAAPAEPYRGTN